MCLFVCLYIEPNLVFYILVMDYPRCAFGFEIGMCKNHDFLTRFNNRARERKKEQGTPPSSQGSSLLFFVLINHRVRETSSGQREEAFIKQIPEMGLYYGKDLLFTQRYLFVL